MLNATFALLIASSTFAGTVTAEQRAFFQKQCFDCHSGGSTEGGLDLASIQFDLGNPERFALWERLHDRVAKGEMPPKSAEQPSVSERNKFTQALAKELIAAHSAEKGTALRRLNRREYQNTLNDIFGTNARLVDLLPEDGRSHEFDNVGESLSISLVQMQRYLEGINTVLDDCIQRTIGPPERKLTKASYATTQGAEQWLGKVWLKRDDGAVVFFKNYGYPSGMLREAGTQQAGWYKVRVSGYAFQSDKPITFGLGAMTFNRGFEQPTFGYFEIPPGPPTTIEVTRYIPSRYMMELTVHGITDRNALRKTPATEYKGPGLAIQSIEVDGPIVEEFPGRGHRLIFDGLKRDEVMPKNLADRKRPLFKPSFATSSTDPTKDVTVVLTRVATKAFRRPATAEQLKPYLDLFAAEQKAGAKFEEALRTAIAAIFVSPEFLFFNEKAGPLDDYAIASRLAYFLNRTTPDDVLLDAAAAGKLNTPAELTAQVERLLAHPHSSRFVVDFTDAWLNLRDIEFTTPDTQLFPEFDRYLQWSSVEETQAFFRKLIDDNLSAANVIHSDFAMLNGRLAEHYGIPGVSGPEIRSVPLSADSVRGGILGQASVLKVSANGTNTSPVVRGVWVTERILGQFVPPPPPGIPGVEPDIRGATTLRELLDKHRSLDNCKGCHQKIDPPGFALESFDPVGGWRDNFRSLGGGKRVDLFVRDSKVRYTLGSPVDASGELPDGRAFKGYREFRNLLAAQKEPLARTLTAKLLTFATGREMGFSDRSEIDRIVANAKASEYGVRDLIRGVVGSDIFRRK